MEELSKAIDALSEKVAIQEMTLNIIKEAADRLEEKLDLVLKEQRIEPYVIDTELTEEQTQKIKDWIINDRYYLPERFRDASNGE